MIEIHRGHNRNTGYWKVKKTNRTIPILAAIGGAIAATPAAALEVGEMQVHSALGQPLRATISYVLGPNEAISDRCVTLQRVRGGHLPSIGNGSLVVAGGVISVVGDSIVREPVVSMRLSVQCQYTPRLTREYLLFVDPPGADASSVPLPAHAANRPAAVEPPRIAERPRAEPEPVVATAPEPRPARPATVEPQPARAAAVEPQTATPAAAPEPVAAAAAPAAAYDPGIAEAREPDAVDLPGPAVPEAVLLDELPVPEPVLPEEELRPGDIIVAAPVPAPAARIEAEAAPPASIIRQPAGQPASQPNWLLWIGGSVAALGLVLLAFGGQLRDRFGSTPIAPATPRPRPVENEEPAPIVEDTIQEEAIGDVDIDISDDSPTAENLALDADLIMGTGLSDTSDVDVATDFAFAATTELDLELTREMAEDTDETGIRETDIIPPLSADESSILKSEVLPEDDDYDMSVIVDATKMPDPADVTERDLAAISVDDDDDTLIGDDYTLSKDVDYNILEQDYQDEMTATQLINEEIQRATEDQAANDDTSINPTVNMNAEDDTVEMPRKGNKTG